MKKYLIFFFLAPCLFFLLSNSAHAAVLAPTNWYIHVNGSSTNCGGFDNSDYPGGTNYADQDTAQVTFSSGNSNLLSTPGANATTLTSAGTPFTAAMVGNCIRITTSTATNFVSGYYFITSVTDSSDVVLDRTPSPSGAASSGTGSLGGAQSSLMSFTNNGVLGGLPSPLITSPLVPGNTINIQGSGSLDKATSTPDYDYSAGYTTFPSGTGLGGIIKVIGYNGRPEIKVSGLLGYQTGGWYFEHIKFVHAVSEIYPQYGIFNTGASAYDCIIDTDGNNDMGFAAGGGQALDAVFMDNEVRNSGSQAQGSEVDGGVFVVTYPAIVKDNYIHNVRTTGILMFATMASIENNIIVNSGGDGIYWDTISNYGADLENNTINNNALDGIRLQNSNLFMIFSATNNILSNNGRYGIDETSTLASTLLFGTNRFVDYNDYFNNGSGTYNAIPAGTHDLTLNPQYVSTSTGNYAIGTNLASQGFPGTFLNSLSTGYIDMGAVQRQPATGSAGTVKINGKVTIH